VDYSLLMKKVEAAADVKREAEEAERQGMSARSSQRDGPHPLYFSSSA